MQKTELLISLPTNLSCTILRDWLTLKSVIALDSAYCCKSLRQPFLAVLHADEYFVVEEVVDVNNGYPLQLFEKFGLKLRSVTFLKSASSKQLNMVATQCHNLTHVHFNGLNTCKAESWAILKANPKLECVTLTTWCVRYSGPPDTFPSCADVESSNFHKLARNESLRSDQFVDVLKMNRNIVSLSLSRTAGADHAVLLQIPQLCPRLTALGLQYMYVTNSVLCAITAACPNLVHLDISGNHTLSDDGICGIAQKLKSLNIQGNVNITDASLTHIYTQCADTLHTLYVSFYKDRFTCVAMNELLRRCTQLRTLGVTADDSNRYGFGVKGLFPPSIDKLRTLVLSGKVFNNKNLASIGKYGANLEVLSLPVLNNFTSHALIRLYDGCPKLKKLYISEGRKEGRVSLSDGNPNIRVFAWLALDLWKRHRPGLQIIETGPGEWPVEYNVMTA